MNEGSVEAHKNKIFSLIEGTVAERLARLFEDVEGFDLIFADAVTSLADGRSGVTYTELAHICNNCSIRMEYLIDYTDDYFEENYGMILESVRKRGKGG